MKHIELMLNSTFILSVGDGRYFTGFGASLMPQGCAEDLVDAITDPGDAWSWVENLDYSDWFPYVQRGSVMEAMQALNDKVAKWFHDKEWENRVKAVGMYSKVNGSVNYKLLHDFPFLKFQDIDDDYFWDYIKQCQHG